MLASLFAQDFSPHGLCLLWDPALLWLHAGSDFLTGLAYYAIPGALASIVLRRRELVFGWMFWLFALFILACGTGHFMDVWVLWHPDYAIQGVIKGFTAIASALTASLLWCILPRLLALPTPTQFRHVSNQLSDETTRHERTVEKLRQTEQTFQLLVESVNDCAMFMLDPSGHVSSWNAGAQRIKQYEAFEVIGRHFSCFYTEADQMAGKPALALDTAATKGSHQEEGPRVRRDGSAFDADILINPIRDQDGVLEGFAAITRDITKRKQAESDLEQARATLAQAQKMEAVGQLTGGIAHDFNNMLTAILGSVDMLEMRQDGPSNRMLQVIRHAADNGAELTRRLLAFSRKQALAPALIDMNRLVSGMSELLRRTLGEAITVETVLAGRLWPAFVDPNQVESALVNLAVNARDAMADGGKLTIETGNIVLEDDYVRRHAELKPGQYAFIAVSDTGTGMSPEVLQRALEPFYTTKESGRGTGLGLSQVYGFVRQSGGHFELYSEVGRGTTVKMYFPRPDQEQEAPRLAVEAETMPLPHGSETILIVDDNEDVRSYATSAARHLGYNVLEAGDAPHAMAILDARSDVDLLFTDVGLPGMNGSELAQLAKRGRPELKIVFTSGYARTAISNLGLLDRGVQFLPKPFRTEGFARVVRSALETV